MPVRRYWHWDLEGRAWQRCDDMNSSHLIIYIVRRLQGCPSRAICVPFYCYRLACCLSLLHLFHFQRENIHKGESLEIVAEHEAHTEEGVALDVGEHVALPFAVCACIKRVPEVIFANCHLPVGQCQCLLHIARI